MGDLEGQTKRVCTPEDKFISAEAIREEWKKKDPTEHIVFFEGTFKKGTQNG